LRRWRRLWSECGRGGCCGWRTRRRKLICGHGVRWRADGRMSVGSRVPARANPDGDGLGHAAVVIPGGEGSKGGMAL